MKYFEGNWSKVVVFITWTILLLPLSAINPPNKGSFPINFWEVMRDRGVGIDYGDPGWKKKIHDWSIAANRNTQLEFHVPVLLGKYANATSYFNAVDFQNLLFDNNPDGSMKEYYAEISYGNFLVDGVAGGWYQSTYTMEQAEQNTRGYVAEVVQLADPDYDFSQYDNDGPDNVPNSGDDDGFVDGIIVVYSGCGAEVNEGNNNIWPHQSSLNNDQYQTNDPSANGGYVIVNTYAVCPELSGGGDCWTDQIRPIGVYAHEFGHVLGLPDLYDRDNSSAGIGSWCLMASGSHNGGLGTIPAHMSAWCKMQMNWLDPEVLTNDAMDFTFPPIANNDFALQIWEDDYNWSRYFIIENRKSFGFDSALPGYGLMVYHIDENKAWGINRWNGGSVNDDETHKLVDLEEADGNDNLDNNQNGGDDGDPYPGSSNNIEFSGNSYPNSNRYNGNTSGISLANINDQDSVVVADVTIRPDQGYAIVYDEQGISGLSYGYSDPAIDTWGGVLFTPTADGYLTEIDIGIVADQATIGLHFYESFDGSIPEEELLETTVTATTSGWISVSIDSIAVYENTDFFIAINMNENFLSIDNAGDLDGRTYISSNGVNFNNGLSNSGDLNLRAKISTTATTIDIQSNTIPVIFKLSQNYPNPFNPVTTLHYDLPVNGLVNITIYDMLGRKVKTLINQTLDAGYKSVIWDATNDYGKLVSAGIYLYQLRTGEYSSTKKMLLLK